MKKAIATLIIFFLALVIMSTHSQVTAQSEVSTPSSVTISSYIAIGLSNDLANGIEFGNLVPGTNDNPAFDNDKGEGGGTSMWVEVSPESNVGVDLCIKDNQPLTSNGNQIPNEGYTWSDNRDPMLPNLPGTPISTTYRKTNEIALAPGERDYFRFWLDVPTAQPPGTYTNLVYFKAVETGLPC